MWGWNSFDCCCPCRNNNGIDSCWGIFIVIIIIFFLFWGSGRGRDAC